MKENSKQWWLIPSMYQTLYFLLPLLLLLIIFICILNICYYSYKKTGPPTRQHTPDDMRPTTHIQQDIVGLDTVSEDTHKAQEKGGPREWDSFVGKGVGIEDIFLEKGRRPMWWRTVSVWTKRGIKSSLEGHILNYVHSSLIYNSQKLERTYVLLKQV